MPKHGLVNFIKHLENPHIFFVSFVTNFQITTNFNLIYTKDNKIFKNEPKIINFEKQKFYY